MHIYMYIYLHYILIYMYMRIWTYMYICFRVLSNAMATQVESDGIVPHISYCFGHIQSYNENRRVAGEKRFNVILNRWKGIAFTSTTVSPSIVRINVVTNFNGSRVERKAHRRSVMIFVDAKVSELACAKITAWSISESRCESVVKRFTLTLKCQCITRICFYRDY